MDINCLITFDSKHKINKSILQKNIFNYFPFYYPFLTQSLYLFGVFIQLLLHKMLVRHQERQTPDESFFCNELDLNPSLSTRTKS